MFFRIHVIVFLLATYFEFYFEFLSLKVRWKSLNKGNITINLIEHIKVLNALSM